MRSTRPLAVVAAALLLGTALPGTGLALAHQAADRPLRTALFAGLLNGYVYRSADGGANWQEADTGLPSYTDVAALAGASTAVYAGTRGSGIYISTDNGQNWQQDNGGNSDLANASVSGLVTNPNYPAMVYAVTTDDKVYVSYNTGRGWAESTLPTQQPITALALDPQRPSTLLVGTANDGVLVSSDSGGTWNYASENIPSSALVNALAFNPHSADVAYAATSEGIYQTINGGDTWQLDQRGLPDATDFSSVTVDPRNGSQVLASSGDGGFYRSLDGGTSWSYMDTSGGNRINALLFDPVQPGAVLAGSADGSSFYTSADNGADWQPSDKGFGSENGVLCLATATRPSLPSDPVSAPNGNPPGTLYFPASHHIVRYPFLSFYNRYGGLKIFGLPLTEAFFEGGYTVQYFERARLVLSGTRVTITPLGSQFTAGRYFPRAHAVPSTNSLYYFAHTGHTLTGQFLSFWRNHTGSLLFGAPISQPLYERNGDGTGRTYLVQYFQNARMEYHPELSGTGNLVTLGQLGRQTLHQRGWI